MHHRLFHTLVLSSASLIVGCASAPRPAATTVASTAPAQAEAPAPAPTTAPAVAEAPAPDDTPAPAPRRDVSALSAEELQTVLRDVRTCSPGWPTTKGASLFPPQAVSRNGHTYACVWRDGSGFSCCERAAAR
ncbi:MAG: hypothetical protein U0325_21675 [Polyangiales bacterium]